MYSEQAANDDPDPRARWLEAERLFDQLTDCHNELTYDIRNEDYFLSISLSDLTEMRDNIRCLEGRLSGFLFVSWQANMDRDERSRRASEIEEEIRSAQSLLPELEEICDVQTRAIEEKYTRVRALMVDCITAESLAYGWAKQPNDKPWRVLCSHELRRQKMIF